MEHMTASGISLRLAQAYDSRSLSQIDKLCFSEPWSEKSFCDAISNPLYRFYVALSGDSVCGYAGMYCVPPESEITNVAVLPEYRRRGIARELVLSLIEESARLDCDAVHLDVRESNIAAIGLYSSLGFITDGKRKAYYRKPTEDALLMTYLRDK